MSLSARQKGVLAALDGDEQIPLPTTVRVTPGAHEVVLSGRGLQPKEMQVQCADFKPLKIDESLPATSGGMMHVHAPVGSNVYIDGRAVGIEEAGKLAVPAGPHDVEVEAPGNAPWHATVVVRPSEQTDVTPQFHTAGMGITGLEVVAFPTTASLWFDGKPLVAGVMTATKPGPHLVEGARARAPALHAQAGLAARRGDARGGAAHQDSLVPLVVGIAFGAIAIGAETTAIVAHVKAGNEVQNSADYNTWHAAEIAGRVTAGACAAVAIAGITLDVLQRRSGLEQPGNQSGGSGGDAPRVSIAVAPAQSGGSLVVTGSF